MSTSARGRRRLNPVPESFRLGFARRLESARHRRKISQEGLAYAAGCSTAFIQNLESGKRGCGHWLLLRICLALKVRADWLLGIGSNEEN